MSQSHRTAVQAASPQRGALGGVPGARVSQFSEAVGPANDAFEQEADRIADAVLHGGRWHPPRQGGWSAASGPDGQGAPIRRAPKAVAEQAPIAAPEPAAPARAPQPAAAVTDAAPVLLVADDAEVTRGQMRKSEFMKALRAGICASVDAALAGTGRDSQGCPWIDHWLGYYEARGAADIERALLRYAPEAAGASSASQYIRVVSARVSVSARRWANTGEVTGLPEEAPAGGAAGGLLAGVGAMFFKARSGGAQAADPVSVREELGRGESLGSGLRSRMEGAFGTSFAAVRLHTDGAAARMSNRLNARAFAVGPHVAFGAGEFQPGTLAGDALIAHELAHVVQQGHAATALDGRADARGAAASTEALEQDADRSAAGAAAALWGAGSFSELRSQARPRMRSGLSLQRCGGGQKAAAGPQVKVKLSPAQERQDSIAGASERLRDVDKWVSLQQKVQKVPDIKGVSKLDNEQATNVATAIQLLTKASALSGAKALDPLRPKLKDVLDQTKVANNPKTGYGPQDDALASKHALNLAITASNELDELVVKASALVDVKDIKKDSDAIATALAGAQSNPGTIADAKDEVEKRVKSIGKQITEIQSRDTETPKAMEHVIFVLRSFLALNAPARGKAPSEEEIKTFTSEAHNLQHDFGIVFGEGKVVQGFDAFLLYADLLEKQLAVRAKMAQAKVAAKPIPTQGNAEDYFKSLKGKKNDEVFAAYTDYASAFFLHGQVATLADMDVVDVSELYKTQLSVFGVRRLVCTGYALLGAHLMVEAGASLREFVVAVRATDTDIAANKIDEGHALAHLTRQGKHFWVSNHLIVMTENDGIGPNAVAWEKKDAPLHKHSGPTLKAANQALADALAGGGRRPAQPGGRRR